MELIIASNNKGKIKEFKDIFEPLGYTVFSQSEKNIDLEVEETGTTFEENAVLKAQAIYDATHQCVISDDSGLEVEALNNEPGIYSARYKGLATEHERRMAVLEGLCSAENRSARFVTCICFIDRNGEKRIFKGIWNGTIAYAEAGNNGFGYDPIFISEDGDGQTTASLPISFKEKYSHRAKAVKKLVDYLHVAETLNELQIDYQIVEHEPALTTELADRFIEGIEGVRTKTMFLTNKKKTHLYLVIMDDNKRLNTDAFKLLVDEKQIKMASSESLYEKMLLQPGVVSPFGLLNNKDHDIAVYIDREIIDEKRMSFHPNTNEKTLFLDTKDLLKYLEAIGYEVNIVDL